MDFMDFLRAVLALALTLGLIGLASVGLKRYAPGFLTRIQTRGGVVKRLQVVETLVLGPTQRLLLVRVGDSERLILLGEGHELDAPPPGAPASATPAPISTPIPMTLKSLFAARPRKPS